MAYKHTFNRDRNYLAHFNPNHDPKNGRFTFKTTSDAAKKDVDDTIASRKEAYDKAMDLGRKVSEEADNLGKEYARFFNNISPTDKEKDEILTRMEHDCGISKDSTSESRLQRIKDNCDDPELYELLLMDHIGYYIDKKMSENKELQNKRASFDKLQSDYWNSIRDVIGDLENKYKNAEFKNPIFKSKPYKNGADDQTYTSSELFINNYIYGKKMGTSWNSYIYRHFDDYWVNDLDENYDAFDRIEKELGEVKHSDMNGNYLAHFNKNHSKANGQFISGDGDGDGQIDDHAHRSRREIANKKVINKEINFQNRKIESLKKQRQMYDDNIDLIKREGKNELLKTGTDPETADKAVEIVISKRKRERDWIDYQIKNLEKYNKTIDQLDVSKATRFQVEMMYRKVGNKTLEDINKFDKIYRGETLNI